jgi:pimeloyl-ACP methyl ester carboxylesterase
MNVNAEIRNMKRVIIELPIVLLFLGYALIYFMILTPTFGYILIGVFALIAIETGIAIFKFETGNWVNTADFSLYQSEAVQIRTDDGIQLAGTIYKPFREQEHEFDPLPVVILIHGLGSSQYSHPEWALPLVKRGYAVLAYDQRGHGHSGGKRKQIVQLAHDVKNVLDFVQSRPDLDIDRVAVIGHSLGGLVALGQAYDDPRVSCVVGISAPHDLKAQGDEKRNFQRKVVHFVLKLEGLKFNLTDEENEQVSPRFFLRPDPNNTLRVFLIHARDDFVDYQQHFLANVLTADLPKTNTFSY